LASHIRRDARDVRRADRAAGDSERGEIEPLR
jgi:hypothetical protein